MRGSVPRAVASALHVKPRSLPLAVLIRRAFPHTQSQTDLNRATQDRYSTARVSKRPTDEPAARQSRAVLYRCTNVAYPDLER